MKLSIVIPCYNEEQRIGKSLETIHSFVRNINIEHEIIVVDDGSSDRTCEVVLNCCGGENETHRLLRNEKNRGKGYSVRRGVLEATGDYILFSDADLSTPIEEALRLIAKLEDGFDVAIGSRALPNSKVEIRQNFFRELMGKIFNKIARLLTFKGIKDSQCGFKCFKREAAKKIFSLQKLDGFSFDVEVIYLAQKIGFKVAEIPVIWRNSTASKVNVVADPIKMFFDLIKIRVMHINDV
ncbi:MAG: hypothetical protein A3G33_03325 [Omnitrophica bacterium RIFCSPLOWO2_12_FULL_44_17]|uniref:dolichyl-phosphate beta-glucosyltransferase n=1 Tax=Candidatus Danuiimicrobium aquiferis TaxID=1801832 RepID=A0A1G1KU70_9BACT|nr:MAG: hypothetical protein A3B72_06870 [Omnitrophica bacterium RIFCSPHIGHO2_02_FULL_45_28]OGW90196.1 MAG: hypothetical protein A3E74_06450 [Omnitrophica bacterium RIFCSPHIGHO2_12_FULL_44_12]OGW96395.1 MAG: hypothetical protein A3G33_03325 [Omnitrophica bacterium RIFCSPLOWO2_12_FULL_44_17]OGX04865.1 MAG: hypothetical protein A3J12_07805 [Omnitrophica bacterium RIFCSPLOWO2_02_FULL_44_11]